MKTYLSLKQNMQSGSAMLISVIFFLTISLTIVMGIATPILKQVKTSIDLIRSKESFYLAQAATEDALIRLKTNRVVATGDSVTLNNSTATINLSNTVTGRIVTATANVGGRVRKVETEAILGVGVAFNYGVQTGNGGFVLANNAGVNGNVYSNGSIIGSAGSFISGTAVAANSAALVTDQSNGSSGIPPYTINFRNTASTQDIAQSFKVSTTSPVNKIRFYVRKTGTVTNATIRIVNDNAGSPGTTVLSTATLGDSSGAAGVTTSLGWVNATFSSNTQLIAGTTYWIVVDTGSTFSSSNYYTIAANTDYATGTAKIGKYSTQTWNNTSPAGLDIYFELFLGGILSKIEGVSVGAGCGGDARAHTINNTTVSGGNLYCQLGTGNNKTCNTTELDPSPVGYPISEANIDQWKEDAAAGGTYVGDFTATSSSTLGPRKIQGNLIVNGSLTITGTIHVTGNITGSNGATVRLDPAYENKSGLIVADGYIDLSNNMQFSGAAGNASSYILLLTTSTCPNTTPCAPNNAAIYLGNNAGAVILNAQNSKLHFKNGSGASEATAHTIYLENNSVITYTTGLASQVFSSGPSGGWEITRWHEVQ